MNYKYFLLILLLFTIFVEASNNSIKSKLNQITNSLPKGTKFGLIVINPMSNDTIFARNHKASLIPASNTKLFTTAVALALMGADYQVATKLYCDKVQNNSGVISGNLYIKGFGNSLFTEKDLDEMVQSLVNSGIKVIDGDVVADDSFFDQVYSRFDWIEDEKTFVHLPPVSALVINRNYITTQVKRRKRYVNVNKKIADPPAYISNLLLKKLISADISVSGVSRKGITPHSAFEIATSSVPLKNILSIVNKASDNFLAEVLFKTVGAVATGREGTGFNAAQSINKFIEDNDIESTGTKIVDGSGLSRYNQISVGSIVSLLEYIYLNMKLYEPFSNSLSIAGVDGTLGGRMGSSNAEFNFRGKTGTLNGASSVSGYLKTKSGEDVIISMIFEFSKGGINHYRRIQDQIIEILAEYEDIPGY
ncbi:MAG: D-alanyl-D-alanine carboxypeptidase/D-alanyl-D-alanine-endopeptidase [Ignavibacteriaceae bacterium]|nr:D-alanyl-D-alanine carboxypeptidase/D-alanyl-D-alanine-endopeptidase [Ignavibacteriaceae bacterium]